MRYIHGPTEQDKCLWCWSSVNCFAEDPLDKKSVERGCDITCSLAGTSLVYMFISCNVRKGHACVGALTKLVIHYCFHDWSTFPCTISTSTMPPSHGNSFPTLHSGGGQSAIEDRLQSQSLMGHHSERQLSLISWPSRPFPLLSLLTMFVHKRYTPKRSSCYQIFSCLIRMTLSC